ncbi:MAG: hypothetical protein IKW92_00785 [Firmicutes bacterium]|nr:hypothetical protein [Bacillota bacterium]
MRNIIINEKNNTIVITKKFEKAAKRFGSEEYKALKEARADFPAYKVVTSKRTKTNGNKGLTYDFMENYIDAHDKDGFVKAEFETLLAKSEEAEELGATTATYNEIKEWFFNTYPAFAEFQKRREAILGAK